MVLSMVFKGPAEEIIDKLHEVTKDDVINVAQKVSLDTIFFLNKK
jgi:predicted Zn-dependent peptidase